MFLLVVLFRPREGECGKDRQMEWKCLVTGWGGLRCNSEMHLRKEGAVKSTWAAIFSLQGV